MECVWTQVVFIYIYSVFNGVQPRRIYESIHAPTTRLLAVPTRLRRARERSDYSPVHGGRERSHPRFLCARVSPLPNLVHVPKALKSSVVRQHTM